jgi:hypothetical protein
MSKVPLVGLAVGKSTEWNATANELDKLGKNIGKTKAEANGFGGALLGLLDKTHRYGSAIQQLPKRAVTEISNPGWTATYKNITRLVDKYHLTPKMVRTLIKETGATLTKGQMQKVIEKAKEVGRQKPNVKVSADTSRAREQMRTLMTYINGLVGHVKVEKRVTTLQGLLDPNSFTGNPVPHAGWRSTVGEIAPEAFITRGGRMDIIGKNGPESWKAPSSGAILPHTALQNPFGGATGNAPKWAVEALQKKAAASVAPAPSSGGGSRGSSGLADLPPISVKVDASGSGMDEAKLKAAVKKGVAQALREERERRINHGWADGE